MGTRIKQSAVNPQWGVCVCRMASEDPSEEVTLKMGSDKTRELDLGKERKTISGRVRN